MSIFTGAGVAIVTPFHKDGTVNYQEFEKLIEFQLENGTDAIIVAGTTGEASTLTLEEHLDIIKYCVEVTDGRVPVIAGAGSNCTETAAYLSKKAENFGAEGLLLVSPYYNKATQKGLYEHFKKAAAAVRIPVLLYNVPSRTGCNIEPETAVKLCREVNNISGIKEAGGNISQVAELLSLADGNVDVYSGNDDQTVPILSLGGKGVISVLANVAPKQVHDMCRLFFEGNIKESARLQLEAMELINALFCEVNPIPVKSSLELLGFAAGPLRLPLTQLEPEHRIRLKNAMLDYGIIK